MHFKTLATFAAIIVLLGGCGSSTSEAIGKPSVSIGKSVASPTRNETVQAYAERVLAQSFDGPLADEAQVGDLAIGALKVCIPARAKAQLVRASDYELVLANGERITATTGAISPAFPDRRVSPGSCVHGVLNWVVAADNHPTIVDERTGVEWKPNCPQKTTGSTGPCQDTPGPPQLG